ncbi:lytic murein transglycosylase [Gryllotalpicola reticulitermitis]|uniref:Lytic murein transglycosylase n=1 Tax=Gryllotalpicola reticulitermitis TaxID=1184153 RepID=A0ABV8QB17_9MICO
MKFLFVVLGVAVLLVGGVGAWFSSLPRASTEATQVLPVVRQASVVTDASSTAPGAGATGSGSSDGAGVPGGSAASGGSAGSAGSGVTAGGTTAAPMDTGLVSPTWLTTTAARTGIPARALQAYAGAAIVSETRNAGCELGWNTLAGIGEVESGHGTAGGAHLGADGNEVGAVVGQVIAHGPAKGQQALGPMQMLPSTWARYAVDADGTGQASVDNIDDAALAAADYLCVAGGDLSTGTGWTAAVHAYNPDDAYVVAVRAAADRYAQLAG